MFIKISNAWFWHFSQNEFGPIVFEQTCVLFTVVFEKFLIVSLKKRSMIQNETFRGGKFEYRKFKYRKFKYQLGVVKALTNFKHIIATLRRCENMPAGKKIESN